jgi:putative phosphoesterase
MKLLIASDIHGDLAAAEAILSLFYKESCDKILLLGDILYHGPRNDLPDSYNPKEVIKLLNENRSSILAVRGNCDTEVDQMVLDFPITSDTAIVYDGESDLTLFMSHGHKFSPENLPPLSARTVFLYGHTHVKKIEKVGEIVCLNPGSVTLPKMNNPKTYATYERGKFEIKTLDGVVCDTLSL